MSLTRKYLKEIGIESEKIDLIIEAHTDTVDALKDERDKYKENAEKVKGLEEELELAKENAKTDSEWQEKYEKEHSDFEAYKKEQSEQANKNAIKDAYRKLLKEAGVSEKRIDTVMRVTEWKDISLDKEGKLKDADKLTESIKSDWADFITSTNTSGAKTQTPPATSGGKLTRADIYKKDDRGHYILNASERQKAIAENAESFNQ